MEVLTGKETRKLTPFATLSKVSGGTPAEYINIYFRIYITCILACRAAHGDLRHNNKRSHLPRRGLSPSVAMYVVKRTCQKLNPLHIPDVAKGTKYTQADPVISLIYDAH